jgi:DNA anti-recombination protein RmuC
MYFAIAIALLLVAILAGILFAKLRQELDSLRQQQGIAAQSIASDVGSIKTQMQNLPVALGDIGAVKSQMAGVAAAMQDLGGIKSQVETISGAAESIGGIKSQVETLSTSVQSLGAIQSQVEAISQTVQQIGAIKADLETVKGKEAQLGDLVRKVADKLVGSREVGDAGENILADAFAFFPPGWIERDFKVGGKVVEFALVLPNQKRLPIDSKFPAAQTLEQLGKESDPQQRLRIIKAVEDAVLAKAREAAKYIDPSQTIYLAIAAVPDAAYSLCRKAHFEAIGSNVLVVSYSLALPVVLALYRFQLQYATSIDQQNLELHLRNVEACLNVMDEKLQNSISKAGTMINNACSECMTQIGKIRQSLYSLRQPSLPEQDTEASPLLALNSSTRGD